MDITISVSDRVAKNIQERANGKPIGDFVEEFVKESFSNWHEAENGTKESKRRSHNLLAFAGMFSSGITDTSERMSEIMRETNFDPAEGFTQRPT